MAAMRQPTKDRLRDALRGAADTIAAKNAEIDRLAAQLRDVPKVFLWGAVIGAMFGASVAMAIHAWVSP